MMSRVSRAVVVAIALAFVTLTVAPPAGTQPSQLEPGDGPRPGRRKLRKRLAKLRDRVLRKKVGLSDEKAKKVMAILEGQQAERRELAKQIRSSRRALGQLLRADSEDQDAYAKHFDQLQNGHRALAQLRDQQVTELRKVLTPKEEVKLFHAMEMVKRRFEKRRRNRRGRRGRRRHR
jgi:Spy/CpxP family protein refolding chaperone